MAGLAIAVTPRRYDQVSRRWIDGTLTYVDLCVWGGQAAHMADSLCKGDRVVVQGRWVSRTYTAGGEERRKLEVTVDEIGVSLRWAVAKPARAASRTNLHTRDEEQPPF